MANITVFLSNKPYSFHSGRILLSNIVIRNVSKEKVSKPMYDIGNISKVVLKTEVSPPFVFCKKKKKHI